MILLRKLLVPGLLVLVIAAGGVAYYFYGQTQKMKENPEVNAQKEAEMLVAEVGKLIALPEGETPTIATVSDPERLKDQAFFAQAKVGSKVLVYSEARKAYLYDPIEKKLLEVAPINIGTSTSLNTNP